MFNQNLFKKIFALWLTAASSRAMMETPGSSSAGAASDRPQSQEFQKYWTKEELVFSQNAAREAISDCGFKPEFKLEMMEPPLCPDTWQCISEGLPVFVSTRDFGLPGKVLKGDRASLEFAYVNRPLFIIASTRRPSLASLLPFPEGGEPYGPDVFGIDGIVLLQDYYLAFNEESKRFTLSGSFIVKKGPQITCGSRFSFDPNALEITVETPEETMIFCRDSEGLFISQCGSLILDVIKETLVFEGTNIMEYKKQPAVCIRSRSVDAQTDTGVEIFLKPEGDMDNDCINIITEYFHKKGVKLSILPSEI